MQYGEGNIAPPLLGQAISESLTKIETDVAIIKEDIAVVKADIKSISTLIDNLVALMRDGKNITRAKTARKPL